MEDQVLVENNLPLIEENNEVLVEDVAHKPALKKLKKKLKIPGDSAIKKAQYFYDIDISDIPTAVFNVNKFMGIHPEFFKTHVNKKMIHLSDNQLYFIYKEPVDFNDTIHKVRGKVITGYNKDTQEYTMIVSIRLVRSTPPQVCYIKQIEEYMSNHLKHGTVVELHYNKILNDTIIKYCFYNQNHTQWTDDVKILQDELFLENKQQLFSIINNRCNPNQIGNTTTSWSNMIFHGAPGLGKSTIIYRIAMTLKLSILSVDLSLYLNKKKELYALFHGQEFNLPKSGSSKEHAMNNCIIVLEEFDNSVERLVDIENIYKYKHILTRNYLELKNKDIKKRAGQFHQVSDDVDADDAIRNKVTDHVKNDALDYNDFLEKEMLRDGIDIKNNKIDSTKMDILGMRSHDNEIGAINLELNNIIKSMDEDNTSNILRLSDLLELFQSPCPVKNRMIIATTNHFQKIKTVLPALFRSGRMSNIEFKYLNWDTLNQLTVHYFGKNMTLDPFEIIVPTSEIVELAVKHLLSKSEFNNFENELHALCNSIVKN